MRKMSDQNQGVRVFTFLFKYAMINKTKDSEPDISIGPALAANELI